jgi:coenzyme F420 hydrogenase subunit beta
MGCGVCMSICPFGAVSIVKDIKKGTYKPVISKKCKECGLCIETCFGIGVDPKLNLEIFNRKCEDPILGTFLNSYVGYATDEKIRYSSASGGIVTGLLLFALEEKLVDGILLTKMDKMKPLEPKSFIAKTKSEVISAARSKYCPVPANSLIKIIKENVGRYAVVGLPCHIYGIRKTVSIYPDLADKILFYIGIFCGGMPNFLATEYLLRNLKVRKEAVTRLEYRGEGWPGKMLIELKNFKKNKRNRLILSYPEYWDGFGSLFFPHKCTLCTDGFNKFADISCGDAWLPEFRGDNLGTSLIIARNEVGERLVTDAYEKGMIIIRNIDCARIKDAQKSMIRFKTRKLKARFNLLKTIGKSLPVYDKQTIERFQSTLADYIQGVLFYFFRSIASKCYLWNFLNAYYVLRQHIPQVFVRRARKILQSK